MNTVKFIGMDVHKKTITIAIADQRLFQQALNTLSEAVAGADADQLRRLQERRDELLATAKQAHDRLLAGARRDAEAGNLAKAITDLASAEHRFPIGEEFAGMVGSFFEFPMPAHDGIEGFAGATEIQGTRLEVDHGQPSWVVSRMTPPPPAAGFSTSV